jgi:hypothetical protein
MDVIKYMAEKYSPWGWVGQRSHDAAVISRYLPLGAVLSCDSGSETDLFLRGVPFFSLEKHVPLRRNWSNNDLDMALEGPPGEKFRDMFKEAGQDINMICYRSLKSLESYSSSGNIRMLSASSVLKRRFDDKFLFYDNLQRMGIERIPGRKGVLGAERWKDLKKELSLPFVVRFPYGSSGKYTFIIENDRDLRLLTEGHRGKEVLLNKYIGGFSLNMNAAVMTTADGVKIICSRPSVQLTGVPGCSNFPAQFCGNDFSATDRVDDNILKEMGRQTEITGKWMASEDFRGVFGMDFLISGKKVLPLEINPRFQNSTALYDQLKSFEGVPFMFFVMQAAEFLQKRDKRLRSFIEKTDTGDFMSPLGGSQLILHNMGSESTVSRQVPAGIYDLSGESVRFLKKEAVLCPDGSPGQILLTCGVPAKGLRITHGAPLCKIQLLSQLVDAYNMKDIAPDIKDALPRIYSLFGLTSRNELEVVI